MSHRSFDPGEPAPPVSNHLIRNPFDRFAIRISTPLKRRAGFDTRFVWISRISYDPPNSPTDRKRIALSSPLRILLVSARLDRHARQLLAAFEARGAVATLASLSSIGIDTNTPSGLAIPGFGDALPDAVCVRTMDGGSFEAVTRLLAVLHGLKALGVPVSNDAAAIEICTDKSATSFRLKAAGLPSPFVVCVETREAAEAALEQAAGPMVLKPLFGSQGKGLKLVCDPADLPGPEDVAGGVYYLQRFAAKPVGTRWTDYRILVSAGRAVAGMRREAANWITNIKQGATALPMVEPDGELAELAVRAAQAVGADFCGVDLLRDTEGRAQIIEVNSMPAWTGVELATGLDIAAIRVGDLLARLKADTRIPETIASLPRAV